MRNFKALCTFLFPLIEPAAALTATVINVTIRSSFAGEARAQAHVKRGASGRRQGSRFWVSRARRPGHCAHLGREILPLDSLRPWRPCFAARDLVRHKGAAGVEWAAWAERGGHDGKPVRSSRSIVAGPMASTSHDGGRQDFLAVSLGPDGPYFAHPDETRLSIEHLSSFTPATMLQLIEDAMGQCVPGLGEPPPDLSDNPHPDGLTLSKKLGLPECRMRLEKGGDDLPALGAGSRGWTNTQSRACR
jgi:hypothetical protein